MTPSVLRIGSRASTLARTQTEWMAERLGDGVCLVWIRSEGDQDTSRPLTELGGTGVFTAALHRALLADRCDVAVHSLKDLPVVEDPGIVLGAVPVREDPRDALVARDGLTLATLPRGAKVATGSPRRVAQLKRARPDLQVLGLRGNVDTRLRRVKDGDFDAVVLALAGLKRMQRDGEVTDILDPSVMMPAPAQGALGLTIREGDAHAEGRLRPVMDLKAAAAVSAERAALHGLGAGCHAPVGALAEVHDGRVVLRVRVLSLDGTQCLDEAGEASVSEARTLGLSLANALLARGAGPLVAS